MPEMYDSDEFRKALLSVMREDCHPLVRMAKTKSSRSRSSVLRGGKMAQYIDGKTFNQLFADTVKNHDDICLGIQKIVEGVARRQPFNKKYPEEREDITSEVLCHCISKIPKFDPQKSSNAFAYFTECSFRWFAYCWIHQTKKKQLHQKYQKQTAKFSCREERLETSPIRGCGRRLPAYTL